MPAGDTGGVPEGDTVWLAAQRMNTALSGATLRRGEFRLPQLAALDLTGSTVREVVPRGKHMLIRLADEDRLVGHLGPDVLGPDWDLDEALRRLREHPDEQVGVAILDQRNLAGIGNLYKVETLFICGVHPWARVGDVENLEAVVEKARVLMLANRNHPEQSTTGSTRRGEDHWVAGRKGKPCRRCGTPILLGEQGPTTQERVTWWCPKCQAARSPIDPRARTGEPGRPPMLPTAT